MLKSKSKKHNGITQILRRIEDFLIPPLCIICDGALGGDKWFCAACLDALAKNHGARDACPRCSGNRRKRECACEFAWDFPFEKVFAAYDYDDTLSAVARHIKYKGKSQLAYHMGFITAPLLPLDFIGVDDIVIPVPLHRARLRKRGYNQAEYFARGLLKGLGRNLEPLRTDLLTRVRNTGTQTKLDREGRLKNLEGAFAANPEALGELSGRRVVLVDDIFTTGATTEACTDELLRAGCPSVRVLAMGHD